MTKRSHALTFASVLVTTWSLSSVSPTFAESRAKYGGMIMASMSADVGTPLPLPAPLAGSHELSQLVHEGLYRVGDGGVVPMLADGLPTAVDSHTVRIKLRPGLVFHDGTPISAADVVASLQRARSLGWSLGAVSQVSAPSADVVVLALAAAQPNLAWILALPQNAIMPAGRTDGMVGAGPFRWSKRNADKHYVELLGFDQHVMGKPFVDGVRLYWHAEAANEAKQFEVGALHLSRRGATAFAGAKPLVKAQRIDMAPMHLVFLGFGRRHPVVRELGLRKALDAAIARNGLVSLGSGEAIVPTKTPLPGTGARVLAEDLDAARQAIGPVLSKYPALASTEAIEILYDQTKLDDREVADRTVRALERIGVVAKPSGVSHAVFRQRVAAGQCDIYIGGLTLPANQAPLWWTAVTAFDGHVNTSPASAAATFATQLPVIPLFHRGMRVHSRVSLAGVAIDALGQIRYDDMFVWLGRDLSPGATR